MGWGLCVRGSDGFSILASVVAEGVGSGYSQAKCLGFGPQKQPLPWGSEAWAPCAPACIGSPGSVVLGSVASAWQVKYPETLLGFFTALSEAGEVAWFPPSLCWASGLWQWGHRHPGTAIRPALTPAAPRGMRGSITKGVPSLLP